MSGDHPSVVRMLRSAPRERRRREREECPSWQASCRGVRPRWREEGRREGVEEEGGRRREGRGRKEVEGRRRVEEEGGGEGWGMGRK